MITKQQLFVIIAAIVVLICIAIGIGIYQSVQREASFTITEVGDSNDTTQIIEVDYGDRTDLLTSAQKRQLPETLLLKSSKKPPEADRLTASVRENSITTSGGETLFIVDIEKLQTSYLISRYVGTEESVDIVNVLCVPQDKRLYEPDNCYES